MTNVVQSDWLVELSHMQSHVGPYSLLVKLSRASGGYRRYPWYPTLVGWEVGI